MGNILDPDVQNGTTTMEIPEWLKTAYQANMGAGQALANRPYTPYDQQMIAGFNPIQNNAIGSANLYGNMGMGALGNSYNALTNSTGANMAAGAYGGMQQLLGQLGANGAPQVGYNNANAVNASRGAVRDVSGGSFLDQNMGAYMNPYTQNVSNNVMSDMNRMGTLQQNQNNAGAAAAGAFGGSRHGVQNAVTNSEAQRNYGQMSNQLWNQAYDSATGLAGQDLTRGFQAGVSNQGMDWNTQALNAQLGTQTNLANASNKLTADLGNQNASTNQNALMGNILGNMSSTGINMGNLGLSQGIALQNYGQAGLNAQNAAGQMVQGQEQNQLTNNYNQWVEARDWAPNQFGYQTGSMPTGQTGGSTTQPFYGPSPMQQGLGILGSIYGMWGGGGGGGGGGGK